ncbi:MAG TPA: PAS domain-containing protein [Terriglobales bacterium]|nr:PAS domain-containing protein [Terriglobales bacterium]
MTPKEAKKKPSVADASAGLVALDTGALTPELVNLILTHLPVDVSFVDAEDTVRYYSATPHRIFTRTPAVIGRKVQDCHPAKSVGTVANILEAFKLGAKDAAEFWIELGGRFVHIRYFAVRDAGGRYRGCLEVSQDVTRIRALKGEQRLLDWDRASGGTP